MVSLQVAVLALAISAPGDSFPARDRFSARDRGPAGETVLIDFYADWCGPCRQMDDTIKQLAAQGYPVRKVNIDENQRLATQHQVSEIPCLVLLVDGREVNRTKGATRLADLQRMFQRAGIAPAERAKGPISVGRQPRARAQSPDPGQSAPGQVGPGQDTPARRQTFPSIESAQPLVDVVRAGGDAVAPNRSHVPANSATAAGGGLRDVSGGELRDALTARLLAASVRLRVNDGGSHSVGSGTVIDAREGEALVLTCGHVFRDSKGKGPIEVDLFGPGAPQGMRGKLISYDLPSDVGLVSFRPGVVVGAVRVAPLTYNVRPNDSVINIGCNHGSSPTLRASRVTAINKFLGPPHLIVAGQPVQGRSGGGLFTSDGLLIGVCNAADPADDGGMYASLGAIHAELDRMGLAEMCLEDADPESGNVALAALEPPPMAVRMPAPHSQPSPSTLLPTSDDDSALATASAPSTAQPAAGNNTQRGDERLTPSEKAVLEEIRNRAERAEVICIVRPLDDPRAKSEVIVLDRASHEFLRQLSEVRTKAKRKPAGP